ncbi:hypothetical protein FGB62_89g124 [Gracilaria domingensis]|nr:hypothetical protein FGB62_89g124 [Gracilaria domingensis]
MSARDERVIYQWNRIYSPVIALAFFSEPYYDTMRKEVIQKYGEDFAGMGNGSILEQCHLALELLASDDWHHTRLVNNLMNHGVSPHILLQRLKNWHPFFVWGQLQVNIPDLSKALIKVFKSPPSSVGVERNPKGGRTHLHEPQGQNGRIKSRKTGCNSS